MPNRPDIMNIYLAYSVPGYSSVRQKYPLSPVLSALYLEASCHSDADCGIVRGFYLQSIEIKMLAFADDVVVFSSDIASVTVSQVVQLTNSFL